MILATNSTGTSSPLSIKPLATLPFSVPFLISALSKEPVSTCGKFKYSANLLVCVPLPQAGGPKKINSFFINFTSYCIYKKISFEIFINLIIKGNLNNSPKIICIMYQYLLRKQRYFE